MNRRATRVLGVLLMLTGHLSPADASSERFYPLIEKPAHIKMALARCEREWTALYEQEYQSRTQILRQYGTTPDVGGVLLGALSANLSSSQARDVADRHFYQCMVLQGWSSDPADDFYKK